MAGGALAQALPLLLGPLLTRLYAPAAVRPLPPVRRGRGQRWRWSPVRATSMRCRWRATTTRRAPWWRCAAAILLAVHRRCCRAWRAAPGPVLHRSSCGRCGCPRRWARCGWLSLATLAAMRAQRFRRAGRQPRAAAWRRRRAAGRGRRGRGRRGGPDRGADRRGAGGRGLAAPAPGAGLARCRARACAAVARRHRDFPLLNTPHAFAGRLAGHAGRGADRRLAGPGRGRLLGPGAALPEGARHAGRRRGVAGAVSGAGGRRRGQRRRAAAPCAA